MGKNKNQNLSRKNKQAFKEITKSINTQISQSEYHSTWCACNKPKHDTDENGEIYCAKCSKTIG